MELHPGPISAPNRPRKGIRETTPELDCCCQQAFGLRFKTRRSSVRMVNARAIPRHPSPPSQTPRPFPLFAEQDGFAPSTRPQKRNPDEPYRRKLRKEDSSGDYVWVLMRSLPRALTTEMRHALIRVSMVASTVLHSYFVQVSNPDCPASESFVRPQARADPLQYPVTSVAQRVD